MRKVRPPARTIAEPVGSVAALLVATALVAFVASGFIVFFVPDRHAGDHSKKSSIGSVPKPAWLVPKLLIPTFVATAAECRRPLADPDFLDIGQGRKRAGLATRKANGRSQPWGHAGLRGRWTPLQRCRVARRCLHSDRRPGCVWPVVESGDGSSTRATGVRTGTHALAASNAGESDLSGKRARRKYAYTMKLRSAAKEHHAETKVTV